MKRVITIRRAYEAPSRGDGFRVLVDRLWPRGVSKDELHVKLWAKEAAPSTALRQWFGHDPERWTAFKQRYKRELAKAPARKAIAEIFDAAGDARTITLVYGAKDEEHNQAVVLREVLARED